MLVASPIVYGLTVRGGAGLEGAPEPPRALLVSDRRIGNEGLDRLGRRIVVPKPLRDELGLTGQHRRHHPLRRGPHAVPTSAHGAAGEEDGASWRRATP